MVIGNFNKKYLLYCLSTISLLFLSCKDKTTYEESSNISVSMINKSLLEQIDDYCRVHSDYKSILVMSDIDENWTGGFKYNNYWIIGPAYKGLGHPSLFFKYKNVVVFLQSSLDGIMDSVYVNKVYHNFSINEHVNVKKNKEELFYDKAILCEHDIEGNFYLVSNRVDTFFQKKRLIFVAPPIE